VLFKPKWVKLLPPNLRPNEKRIGELEKLRSVFGIPHEALAIKRINSFDELCDYIIKLEEKEPSFPDPFDIGKVIDEILAQEVAEKEE